MYFPNLTLTDAGRAIIIKAMNGGTIEFTKVALGNGDEPDDVKAATDLTNLVTDVDISDITTGENCALLDAVYDNSNLEAGFYAKEVGIFATDEDEEEVLYAYANAGENAAYIPAHTASTTVKTTFRFVVAVGDAENITAVISGYIGMVTREEFAEHTENTNNPHHVTAAQVGLGNVPNVAPQNQQPTFTVADNEALTNFQSGDRLGAILQKLHNAVAKLMNHLTAQNPHNITLSSLGAAKSNHGHAATDITSGILGVQRGGTGVTSYSDLAAKLAQYITTPASGLVTAGAYSGNGQNYRFIGLNFTPSAVLVWGDSGVDDYFCGLAVAGHNAAVQAGYENVRVNNSNYHYIRIAIDSGGFYVTQCSYGGHSKTNQSGVSYKYLAFK